MPLTSTILQAPATRASFCGTSKKQVLDAVTEHLAASLNIDEPRDLFDALLARERLGSTALGDGVALPHCRTDLVSAPKAALFTLAEGIDFEAPDDRPVDLVLALVVPTDEVQGHLQLLADVAEALSNPDFREALRHSPSDVALFDLMIAGPDQIPPRTYDTDPQSRDRSAG